MDENKQLSIHIQGYRQETLFMTAALVGKLAEDIPKSVVATAMLFAIENPPDGSTSTVTTRDGAIREALDKFRKNNGGEA